MADDFKLVAANRWEACLDGIPVTITKRLDRATWPKAYLVEVRYRHPRYKGCTGFKAEAQTLARAKTMAKRLVAELTA